jgi:hypothetical protein
MIRPRPIGFLGTFSGTFLALLSIVSLATAQTPCNGPELTTLFASNGGGSLGGQIFFDAVVTDPAGIVVSQIDVNTGVAAGTPFSLSVFTHPNTSNGNYNSPGLWTLVTQGQGVAAGTNVPSLVDVADFTLPPGPWGVSLVLDSSAGHRYTNGNGVNQFFFNPDLTLSLGAALNVPWTGTPFSPRVWNGTIRYDCPGGPPPAYCTAGTTSSGCVPAISGSHAPSVSGANPCSILVANVEGAKNGLLFYGVDNTGFTPTPWGSGGTSHLCVKAPTQRTAPQSTGGNAGQCDGQLVLDWNAYQSANPGALGQPWSTNDKVYVQAWFRDPPAVKTTNLSDALEMTYVP